jgi:hypothetical protein
MFLVRKQLVKPIQDQVYNAIQSIAARKNYDFVFDKSSELVMLYSNKKYDISDLVLSTIDRTRLSDEKKEQMNKKATPNEDLTDRQKELIAKKEEAQEKKEDDIQNKKDAIAEKREALIKKREAQRELLRQKKEALKKKKEEEKKGNN